MAGFLYVGAGLVILACILWGFENNCTRKLSLKDPHQIVMLKGIFSGTGSLIIGLILSFIIFQDKPNALFIFALIIMIIGAWLASNDTPLRDILKKSPMGNKQ